MESLGRPRARAQPPPFILDRLDDRTRPHARSEAPSARPPFGLAAHDASAAPPRVSASLALCHTRLDVNLGVAVRSAEACGLDEVVLVGRGDLLRTATRGTERALRMGDLQLLSLNHDSVALRSGT